MYVIFYYRKRHVVESVNKVQKGYKMPKPENSGKFVINKKVAQGAVNSGRYVADNGGKGNWDNQEDDKTDLRVKESRDNDIIDSKYGFDRYNQVLLI